MENEIQYNIRVALGRIKGLALFVNPVGVAKFKNAMVRYGLAVGSGDLIGILAPTGRIVSLEVKDPNGKTNKKRAKSQRLWRNLVRSLGGYACIVRSVDEALAAITRASNGDVE